MACVSRVTDYMLAADICVCERERELSCGLRLVFMCVGLKQAVVGKAVRNKMLPPNPEIASHRWPHPTGDLTLA